MLDLSFALNQSLGLIQKKLNLMQQKQTFANYHNDTVSQDKYLKKLK